MNNNFITNFLNQGYTLKKECNIVITSCVNYTYYILEHIDTKNLLILENTHACLATTPPEPKIFHLEDLFYSLYEQENEFKKVSDNNYQNDKYKSNYQNEEDYELRKAHCLKFYQDKIDCLQEFIAYYLDILKNKYKN